MRRFSKSGFVYFAAALILIGLDALTKTLAVLYLPSMAPSGLVGFVLAYNSGTAFSLFQGSGLLFAALACVLGAAAAVYLLFFKLNNWLRVFLCLFIAGSFGNAVDRIFRGGKVIDFIYIKYFSVFNIADICLTASVICFLIYMFFIGGSAKSKA